MGTPTDKHSLFVSCLDLTFTNIYPYYKCKRNAVSSMTKDMPSACGRSSLHLNTPDCCSIEYTVTHIFFVLILNPEIEFTNEKIIQETKERKNE